MVVLIKIHDKSNAWRPSPPGTTCSWIDAMPPCLHIPPTALSSTCLSRKSSNQKKLPTMTPIATLTPLTPPVTGVLGTQWQSCMRMETANMRASPSLSFGSLNRRTRRSPPTICTASPGSVRLANAMTLRSDKDEKCEIQHICVFNVEHLSSVTGSNVTTGKRGTLMLLVFQMSLLYPPWPLSPRMTKVSHVLHDTRAPTSVTGM